MKRHPFILRCIKFRPKNIIDKMTVSHKEKKRESRPLVLGLSHIYGETKDLNNQVAFWQSKGLKLKFSWRLPVPYEKQQILLNNPDARYVDLKYLSFGEDNIGTGIEFVNHQPSSKMENPMRGSALTLALQGSKYQKITDLEGNTCIIDPQLSYPVTVIATTPDTQASGNLLSILGFQSIKSFFENGDKLGQLCSTVDQCWVLQLPLFPRLSVRVVLIEEKDQPRVTKIDKIGWNGFSFLTSDLDLVSTRLPLKAYQRITSDDGRMREAAFYNEDGLLIEFLKINKVHD